MKAIELFERVKHLRFRPTLVTEDNCNLEQVIYNYLDTMYPAHQDNVLVARKLSDLHSCKECGLCRRGL
jgi:hypothetical protein